MARRWLIATIGNQDPESPSGPMGPLRTAVQEKPGYVLLIFSRALHDKAEATRKKITDEVPGAQVEMGELRTDDPTDLPRLVDEMQQLLRQAGMEADDEVHICATSGTPTMNMALTLVADVRFPSATHWQALNPAKATGGPLLREFEPDAVRHLPETASAFRALAECRARDAREGFERRLKGPSHVIGRTKPWLLAGCRAAAALALAEDFRTDEAAKEMRAGAVARRNVVEGAPGLKGLASWYGDKVGAAGQRANPHWPVELAATALREERVGRLLLAVVRLGLAHEVALTTRLREKHGIDADRLGPEATEKVRAVLGDDLSLVPVDGYAWRLEGVPQRLRLVARLEGGLEEDLKQQGREQAWKHLSEVRNDIMHRGRFGEPARAREAFNKGVDYLCWLFERFGWANPREVPSAPDQVKQLAHELAAQAGVDV